MSDEELNQSEGESDVERERNKEEETNLKRKSEEPEIEIKTKKIKTRKVFTEEVLLRKDGLRRIYASFPSTCRFRGRGFEAQDLKRMINMVGIAITKLIKTILKFQIRLLVYY
jgi:hypothetical protein